MFTGFVRGLQIGNGSVGIGNRVGGGIGVLLPGRLVRIGVIGFPVHIGSHLLRNSAATHCAEAWRFLVYLDQAPLGCHARKTRQRSLQLPTICTGLNIPVTGLRPAGLLSVWIL